MWICAQVKASVEILQVEFRTFFGRRFLPRRGSWADHRGTGTWGAMWKRRFLLSIFNHAARALYLPRAWCKYNPRALVRKYNKSLYGVDSEKGNNCLLELPNHSLQVTSSLNKVYHCWNVSDTALAHSRHTIVVVYQSAHIGIFRKPADPW